MKTLIFALLILNVSFAKKDPTELLDRAIRQNDIELAKKAIKKGADVNYAQSYGREGMTPLVSIALRKSHFTIASIMINTPGFNADLSTSTTTVVNRALKSHAPMDIIKRLFELGARKKSTGGLARSPFQVAVSASYIEAVNFMLTDRDFSLSEGGRFCALRIAVKFNKTKIVEIIKNSDRFNEMTQSCLNGVEAQLNYNDSH